MTKSNLLVLPTLIDAGDVAVSIKASKKTVYKMAKDGRIPSLNLNGMVRFDPQQINAWIDERRMVA